ncbi:MAG: glycosyltransferase family 4 protein [Flavobacteriales bacterium]|jgi:glycosyltransferase involved in cell wall biosynthesis|nr:glycosyltransferase family 4 protein [Flavobacteriales bacterium]
MRILLVTDGIHPFVMGGMQKHSFYLAKFLARKGVRVHLVHCVPDEVAGREQERTEFKDFDAGNITFESLPFPVSAKLPGHYLRANKRYSAQVLQRVRERLGDFDLVYAQGFTGLAFIEARRRGELRIPVLSNLHGYEMFQAPPSFRARLTRGPMRAMAKRISLGSDAVFSFGGRITGILLNMGVRKEHILECPIGIEEQWLVEKVAAPDRKDRVFIFVGRDERRKGVKELSEAVSGLIRERVTGFRMHVVGPIREENKVMDERITYHGAVHDEERVQALLRASDVLICASYSEGMPTVIMEAMASGLAVIGTDVGAISQQVSDNGWLLTKPDPAAIQAAMLEAIRLPAEVLTAMKRCSLKRVKDQFTWERVIERKLQLLAAWTGRG